MTVIDPMHNLLLGKFIYLESQKIADWPLGLVKNQWYPVWIKDEKTLRSDTGAGTKRELNTIHEMLKNVSQLAADSVHGLISG